MRASIERMLEGSIDYAGLFPPAKLPMDASVRNYLRFVHGAESWIVGRFVCPASRLMEFEQVVSREQPPPSIPLAVIGTGGKDLDAFEDGLALDAEAMTRFEESLGDRCPIEAFEVRTPSFDDLETVIEDLQGFDEIDVFVEVPLGEGLADGLAAIAESDWLGAKARTGGLEAAAFPSADLLADFLQSCRQLDVPMKLTAGLHEPLRHRDKATGGDAHGFLNVFAALALAEANELSRQDVAAILVESSPNAFTFDAAGLGWGEFHADLEAITEMRSLLTGFGSCSIDEPLQGLERLGLLKGVAR
ncbi:MAG: hypothetical protein H6534_00915 [Chthonomonadaceae bacterium]|nr:hypothetical protein [Chthonomonadaceae bacterium]